VAINSHKYCFDNLTEFDLLSMQFANIHFIINPASGNDEPILSWISDTFNKSSITWEVHVTKGSGDATTFTKEAIDQGADCIAVYGGDGSVMEVAESLFKKNIPLAIIPGGTANVLAKELAIPQDTRQALNLLKEENNIKRIDMALCNETPFVIRINVGLMADMITETDRNLKNKVGQLAYAVTAVSQMQNIEEVSYRMVLDDKKINSSGISLVIANSGNVGIPNISLLPIIDINDEFLDVIILKSKDLGALVKWAGAMAVGGMPEGVLDHWKVKKVQIRIPSSQTVMIDDKEIKMKDSDLLTIEVVPQALSVVVPILNP
jgi:diacylglycerol kinase (ATP)